MGKIAYIFPGQASQYPGMGQDLYENFPEARAVFEESDDALGFSISRMCFTGSKEDLVRTEITQPAILAVSIAAYRVLSARIEDPVSVAGHSLGEYSALVASGTVPLDEAVIIVHHRGKYMQEAVPVGEGAMAAIMGLEREQLVSICEQAAQGEIVSPANYNAPSQTVISGHTGAVERALFLCKEQGAKRSVLLPVSAPFHCALMEPAAAKLYPELIGMKRGKFSFPVLKNVDAKAYYSTDEIPDGLKAQITSPVLWQDCAEILAESGAEYMVEVGPGKVLAGLGKRIHRSIGVLPFEDTRTADQTLKTLSTLE